MGSNDKPSLADLPPLPKGCPELRKTASPSLDQPLEQHLESIPALGRTEYEYLDEIATGQRVLEDGPVLGVSDLLRRRQDGSHGLHPHVVCILSPTDIDPTLTHLSKRADEYITYKAYQCLDYLVECRDGDTNSPEIYPDDYRIEVLDMIRDLRANGILTSVRLQGQSCHDSTTLKQEITHSMDEGLAVEGVATLMLAEQGSRFEHPAVVIEDHDVTMGRRSTDELINLCKTLKSRFHALLSIYTASELDRPR